MKRSNAMLAMASYLAAFLSSAAFPAPIAGDVDADDSVNAIDVQLTINDALGIPIGSQENPLSADIDFDGGTNALDVQLVINAALGISIDFDDDGLADGAETNLGTNKELFDTDFDGKGDGQELVDGSDPLLRVLLRARPTSGFAPFQTQLLNESQTVKASTLSWNWDFGDPASGTSNTSSLENPTHVFSNPGRYTVTLTATTEIGVETLTHDDHVVVGGIEEEIPLDEEDVAAWIAPTQNILNADTSTAGTVTSEENSQILHSDGVAEYRVIVDHDTSEAVQDRANARANDETFVAVFRYLGAVLFLNENTDADEGIYLAISTFTQSGTYTTPLGSFEVLAHSSERRFSTYTIGPVPASLLTQLAGEMPSTITSIDDVPILTFDVLRSRVQSANSEAGVVDATPPKDLLSLIDTLATSMLEQVLRTWPQLQWLSSLAKTLQFVYETQQNSTQLKANMDAAATALAAVEFTYGQVDGPQTIATLEEVYASYETLVDPNGNGTDIADLASHVIAGLTALGGGAVGTPVDNLGPLLWGDGSDVPGHLAIALDDVLAVLDSSAEIYLYAVGNAEGGLYIRVNNDDLKLDLSALAAVIDAIQRNPGVLTRADPLSLQGLSDAAHQTQVGATLRAGIQIELGELTHFLTVHQGAFPPESPVQADALLWDMRGILDLQTSPTFQFKYNHDEDTSILAEFVMPFGFTPPYLPLFEVEARFNLFGNPATLTIDLAPAPEVYGLVAFGFEAPLILGNLGAGIAISASATPETLVQLALSAQEFTAQVKSALNAAVIQAVQNAEGAFVGDGLTIELSPEELTPVLADIFETTRDAFQEHASQIRLSLYLFGQGGLGPSLELGKLALELKAGAKISMPLDAIAELFGVAALARWEYVEASTLFAYEDWLNSGDVDLARLARLRYADFLRDVLIRYDTAAGPGDTAFLSRLADQAEGAVASSVKVETAVRAQAGLSLNGGVSGEFGMNLKGSIIVPRTLICNRTFLLNDPSFCDLLTTLNASVSPRIFRRGYIEAGFGLDAQFELLSIGGGLRHKYYSLEILFENWTPKHDARVDLIADKLVTEVGEMITFYYQATTAPGVTVTQFEWDFDGDGIPDQLTYPGPKHALGHLYTAPGVYRPSLTAVASNEFTDVTRWTVNVTEDAGEGEISNWPMDGQNAGRTHWNKQERVLIPPLQQAWLAEIPGHPDDVTVSDSITYVSVGAASGGRSDNAVYALSTVDGTEMWNYFLKDDFGNSSGAAAMDCSVAITAGNAFFGGQISDTFYAVDAITGQERWTLSGAGSMYAQSPAFLGNTLYVISRTLGTLALDPVDRTEIWSSYPIVAGKTSPAVGGGRVYIVADNSIVALSESSGEFLWQTPEVAADEYSVPVYENERVYIPYPDTTQVAALRANDGSILWEASLPSNVARLATGSVSVWNEQIFVVSWENDAGKGQLHALSSENGELLWSFTDSGQGMFTTVAANDILYAGGWQSGDLTALDPATGATLWSYSFPHRLGQLAVAQGRLFLCGSWNKVYAFESVAAPIPGRVHAAAEMTNRR